MSAREDDVSKRLQALAQQMRHDGHATREEQREQGFAEDLLKSVLVEKKPSPSTSAAPDPTSGATVPEEEGMVIVSDYDPNPTATGIATDTPGGAKSSSSWLGRGWLYKGAKGAYDLLPSWKTAPPAADSDEPKEKTRLG